MCVVSLSLPLSLESLRQASAMGSAESLHAVSSKSSSSTSSRYGRSVSDSRLSTNSTFVL